MLCTGVQWGCCALRFSGNAVPRGFSGDAIHWNPVGMLFPGIQRGCCLLGFSRDAVPYSSVLFLEWLSVYGMEGIDPVLPLKQF